MSAEVVVEPDLRAAGAGRQLYDRDLRGASLQLLAEREDRLQEVRTGPDV